MNEENPEPKNDEQTQPEVNQADTPQPTAVEPKKDRKKLIIIAIIIVSLLLIGALVAFLLAQDDTSEDQDKNEGTNTTMPIKEVDPKDETSSPVELKQTTISYGTSTITVQHPKDWKVTDTTETFDSYTLPSLYIQSPKGNYLHLYATSGIGGNCESNTYSYKLTKKLGTATSNVFFTEYSTNDPAFTNQSLIIEEFANKDTSDKTVNEGDSSTDTCTMNHMGIVGIKTGGGITVRIAGSSDKTNPDGFKNFSQISNEPEFVSMLESFKVTSN